jgi:hypothetical protein
VKGTACFRAGAGLKSGLTLAEGIVDDRKFPDARKNKTMLDQLYTIGSSW